MKKILLSLTLLTSLSSYGDSDLYSDLLPKLDRVSEKMSKDILQDISTPEIFKKMKMVLSGGATELDRRSLKYDVMNSFLSSMNGLNNIDSLYLKSSNPKVIDESVPLWMKVFFYRAQMHIFGKEIIRLRYCAEEGGVLSAEYFDKLICIDKKGLKNLITKFKFENNYESVIKFFLTHEIAHFIHELSTSLRNDHRSLNGNVSAYYHDFESFMVEKYGHGFDEYHLLTPKQISDIPNLTKEFTKKASLMHAEVDTFAYLIFTSMGIDIPYNNLELMFKTYSLEDNLGAIDGKNRLTALRQYKALSL